MNAPLPGRHSDEKASSAADSSAARLDVVILETPNLGDRSYVVGRGSQAIVIDPQRDIDRVLDVLEARGWNVTHVLETHFHNDYVSGGLQLARTASAEYVVPAGMDIDFPARRVEDSDVIETGVGRIDVLLTPGHTPNHVSFAASGEHGHDALFTGGSLLFSSVGRPDLLGPALTEPLARAQWKSMRRLAELIDPKASVFPTHGFGSFCSATATVGNASTLGEQIAANPVFHTDQESFVAELIVGLDAFPAYYAHMGPANQSGAGAIDLSLPQRLDAPAIAEHLRSGAWVVDLRQRRLFSARHVPGTLSFDVSGNAVTYLGWLIDWGTPVVLVGADENDIRLMQRELVRIGIDRPAGFAVGGPEDWALAGTHLASYPSINHEALAAEVAHDGRIGLLDVRRDSEFREGHIRGAKHVPLHEVRGRLPEIADWAKGSSGPVRVYCGTGFRAAVGCSVLAAAGVSVVHVDDDFPNAARAGLPITRPSHGQRLGDTYAD